MPTTKFNSLKKIGYLIRFHRRQMGLSQLQMAEAIGVSFRNFQRLESGEVEAKMETLSKVASCMGISLPSLIRPTDGSLLNIIECATEKELNDYKEIFQKNLVNNEDLQLAQDLIKEDRLQAPLAQSDLVAYLDGSKVTLSDQLNALTGVTAKQINIDEHIAFGSCMERWEYVFRSKMNVALIQNFYFFPKGFKVFEEFHYNLKPNPDAPTSECFIRDITARHELESWLKHAHSTNQFR